MIFSFPRNEKTPLREERKTRFHDWRVTTFFGGWRQSFENYFMPKVFCFGKIIFRTLF